MSKTCISIYYDVKYMSKGCQKGVKRMSKGCQMNFFKAFDKLTCN